MREDLESIDVKSMDLAGMDLEGADLKRSGLENIEVENMDREDISRIGIDTEDNGDGISAWDHGEMAAEMKKGGYVCRERLGKGAFSEVFRVENEDGDSFACKVSSDVRMLEREAGIMKEVRHPLFPEFYVFWSRGGLGYLVMEHISGGCLEAMLRRRGGFCPEQVARTGVELAEGLGYLHERGGKLLFRDVKPANIIVRQDGRVKLLDLGCICHRGKRADSRAGTPGYCAPEQLAEGAVLTQACDVYGLGRTLLDMLCRDSESGRGYGTGPDSGKETQGSAGVQRIAGRHSSKKSRRSMGREGRRRRKHRRKLISLLEACTRPDPSLRIADMRTVIAALLELEGGNVGAWRKEVRCRKNIWERDCENP